MHQTPLVSISCITYNHESYLRQCLDSFLMQKTTFPFEIVIHDDASTDDTGNIITEYAQRYPGMIYSLIQQENQFRKGEGSITARFNLPRCRGKYIALCEGDDYWTDEYKLQKQVDLLEQYTQATMCVGLNKQYYEKNGVSLIDKPYKGKNLPLIYLDDTKRQYFHTSTYLIRKSTLDYVRERYLHLFLGDTAIRYLLINEGPFVLLNDVVSVYRITGTGIWSGLSHHKRYMDSYRLYKALRLHHQSGPYFYYLYKETVHLGVGVLLWLWEKIRLFNGI